MISWAKKENISYPIRLLWDCDDILHGAPGGASWNFIFPLDSEYVYSTWLTCLSFEVCIIEADIKTVFTTLHSWPVRETTVIWTRKSYKLGTSNIPLSCVEIFMKYKIALHMTNYIVLTWSFPSFLSSNNVSPFQKTRVQRDIYFLFSRIHTCPL